ncbi:ATP-binding protein [Geminicoccus roseus]|uniref:ATP-binding protein n=1 Tax=Geminicoccus roseus TaxID=404900 RepID=UPI000426F1F9|nr:ATP-binding protein [Geminicoccus roseus]
MALLSGAFTLALCAGLGWVLLDRDRAQILTAAQKDLASTSSTAAGTVRRTLGTLDLVVSLAVDDFQSGTLGREAVYQQLTRRASQDEQVESLATLVMADADGIIVRSRNDDAVGLDLSDRTYFRKHSDAATPGMLIGSPIITRIAPYRWIVPISWALRDPDGRPAGVLAVAAGLHLYAGVFDGLLDARDQTISLVDGDGVLYALDGRHWPDPETAPRPPAALDAWRSLDTTHNGQTVTADAVIAWAHVPGTGLQVVTSEPLADRLGPWWLRLYVALAVILLLALSTGYLSWLRQRSAQSLRAAAQAAEAAAKEARRAQAEAEHAERAKSQFLAAMSHEIRTPMTGVLGMAELLAAEPLQPRQRGYVQAIRTSGQHLLGVINDILDFSRFDAGGLTLEKVDFSLQGFIEQLRSIMAPLATERGLTLDFDLDPQAPMVVRGDPTRLRQILVNLIGNGLKFTSQGGVQVRIGCRNGPDALLLFRFEVEDSGIGIPEDRQSELFQPFMQADRSTARKYGGSGLGLAICRQLVTTMGGEIGIRSRMGQGSTFWFEVLLAPGDAVAVTARSKLDPAMIRPLRILVAEDVEVNRDLLQATLSRHDHTVVFAENGEQAVSAAQSQRFDVILMDVQMPAMDGIEATRRIRAMPPPGGSVPILALTANVMEAERERCLSVGMNGVLTKPIAWDELFRALAAIASQGQAGARADDPPAMPAPDPAGPGAVLFDQARIEGLEVMAGRARLVRFLDDALASAEQIAGEMVRRAADPAEVAKLAHRLAGSAPSFGLVQIGEIARSIEDEARNGRELRDHLLRLNQAIGRTRDELVHRQFLNVPA